MNLTSFCSTDVPLYDQVHDLIRVVEIVLQLSTKKVRMGLKMGVTLDSALRRNHITLLYTGMLCLNPGQIGAGM